MVAAFVVNHIVWLSVFQHVSHLVFVIFEVTKMCFPLLSIACSLTQGRSHPSFTYADWVSGRWWVWPEERGWGSSPYLSSWPPTWAHFPSLSARNSSQMQSARGPASHPEDTPSRCLRPPVYCNTCGKVPKYRAQETLQNLISTVWVPFLYTCLKNVCI